MFRHRHELGVGGLQQFLQAVDCLAPLPIDQAGFDSLQLAQGNAVGAVELHGLGEVKPRLGAKTPTCAAAGQRKNTENRRQHERRRRPEASSVVFHWRPTMTQGR